MPNKPIVAVTMGDPAGVGPEIILKALAHPAVKKTCRPLILGDRGVLERARVKGRNFPKLICLGQDQTGKTMVNDSGGFSVWPLSSLAAKDSRPGSPSRAGGDAAYRYICEAAQLALSKSVDAIATAPISKSILQLAGHYYPGHTELLAELSRTPECRMMLIGKKLRVVLVTGHIGFSKVSRALTPKGVRTTLQLADRGLREFFGLRHPRIAVAALNPHGGEEGIFGDEEKRVIVPALRSAKLDGINADGPFPADSLFYRAARGDYDAVVCMYHDQGLIPLKLHHFFGGVALTLGPPFIRTSVDHGTAYDIAGKNRADPTSMIEAIVLAARLAKIRRKRRI